MLSGLLGIGGGIMLVPSLALLGKLDQRIAHGTSLGGIVIIATVGWIGYILDGKTNFWAALFIAIGALLGVSVGTLFLKRIQLVALKLVFSIFACIIAIRLFVGGLEGSKEAITITFLLALSLILVGLVAGFLSGLLGVGGGIIIVPSLIFIFDLVGAEARGTSLLVILPTALLGSYRNFHFKNIDIKTSLKVGAVGSITAILGAYISVSIPDNTIARVLAGILLIVAIRMFLDFWKLKKS